MNRTWIALTLILIITGQLILLSTFHEVARTEFSGANSVITIAKLNYVDAKITLTVTATPSSSGANATTDVKIICPDGSVVNLTASQGEPPRTYIKTVHLARTGDNFGYTSASFTIGNSTLSLTQEEPIAISINHDVDNPQDYRLSFDNQVAQVSAFIVYGADVASVSCYGVAL